MVSGDAREQAGRPRGGLAGCPRRGGGNSSAKRIVIKDLPSNFDPRPPQRMTPGTLGDASCEKCEEDCKNQGDAAAP
eukprot:1389584-Amorphochlora_amoeboformis.AAC.1